MHFKLLVVFVEDRKTEAVMSAARDSGATGCTVIHHARGEGSKKQASFLGMSLSAHRDVLLMIVEEHLSRRILEHLQRRWRVRRQTGHRHGLSARRGGCSGRRATGGEAGSRGGE